MLLFSLLTGSVSLTEPAGKEKLLGCLCRCRIAASGKIRILSWISPENSQVDTQCFPNNFSKCTVSVVRIPSLHTPLRVNYRNGLKMSKQHWVRVFLQPYPALPADVHRRLFLECCCSSLRISLQVTERVPDHYRLVQTATKCSGNLPFWLEKHLCGGTSITLRIQGTGALIVTHHLFLSKFPPYMSVEE